MGALKKIFTHVRVLILLSIILLSVVAMWPSFDAKGVAIRSVTPDSAAQNASFTNPKSLTPMSWEVIESINTHIIETEADYYAAVETLQEGVPAIIKTSKQSYTLVPRNATKVVYLDELEPVFKPTTINVTSSSDGFILEPQSAIAVDEISQILEIQRERLLDVDNEGIVIGSYPVEDPDVGFIVYVGFSDDDLAEVDKGGVEEAAKEPVELVNSTINFDKVILSDDSNYSEMPAYIVKMQNKTALEQLGLAPIGLRVTQAPTSNIRKGLDLQGGTRVLLKPSEPVDENQLQTIIEILKERLNVYGLSDVPVRQVSDLSFTDNQFILVEVAGANEEEVRDLISQQGKFEAKIGDQLVFIGGNKDIVNVDRSVQSGLDYRNPCRQLAPSYWSCGFRFGITLSPEAAQRFAEITRDLTVITDENGNEHLSQSIDLMLDDKLVDTLQIASDLRGSTTTQIAITGPGNGTTQAEAVDNTLKNMKKLQTVLSTGSLPTSLDVVKSDTVSPILGEEFLRNAMFIGFIAIVAVGVLVFVRYRKLAIALPLLLTSFSEIIVILGFASFVGWNIDLAAIAGIIIAIGTGVDHQIVIADETLKRTTVSFAASWKEKIKRAFFIIMGAYFTTVAAMFPLWFAGAGLLRGFAITTIFGITAGVFISRPAFAQVIEILLRKDQN